MSFVVLWSRIRGFMVTQSWFYGRAFVVLWSRIRGFMVAHSWFYGQNFLVLWSRSSRAIQRPPKLFMHFQVCSGIWFEGGAGIIRMMRRDVLKTEIRYS